MKYKVNNKIFNTLKEAVQEANDINWKHNRNYMFDPAKRIDTTILQVNQ